MKRTVEGALINTAANAPTSKNKICWPAHISLSILSPEKER